MTREEAIHILHNLKPTDTKSGFDAYVVGKAIIMAIQALELTTDKKEIYNKGYKDGQEALAFHTELCIDEGKLIPISVIEDIKADIGRYENDCMLIGTSPCRKCVKNVFGSIYRIIDRHLGKESK